MMIDPRRIYLSKTAATVSLLSLLILLTPSLFPDELAKASTTWIVHPEDSIQNMINIASPGDTILILQGKHEEHIMIDKSLRITGENQNDTIIDGGDSENVVKISADNVTLQDLTIQGGSVGITIDSGKQGTILVENNVHSNQFWGIYGDRSCGVTISDNNISSNGWDGIFMYATEPSLIGDNLLLSNGRAGVLLRYTSHNTLTGNLALSNNVGIYVYSDQDPIRPSTLANSNVLEDNQILNNNCGIRIAHLAQEMTPAENRICRNFIAHNTLGLEIIGSNGNQIYHNDFIDNIEQVSVNESVNTWDNGYLDGGNYWSNHNSPDAHWGTKQNETGSDGIADSSYLISQNPGEADNYPFLGADKWLAPLELAVTSPLNETYRTEQIELSFSTNKPAWITYSLDEQPNTTLISNLVLTEISGKSHSIAMYAKDTLSNEANVFVQFNVTFLEDINVDGVVNIIDVALVAYSFGSTPESPRWNQKVDLDENEEINIVDVAVVAKAYGQQM